jgi:hypothetical protein
LDISKRKLLQARIQAIKGENIRSINLRCREKLLEMFFAKTKRLKPRHSRDIGRIISLTKAFALMNLWHRDRDGATIVANEQDVEEAFKIWDVLPESQEYNLPPYVYDLHRDVILAAFEEKNRDRREGPEEMTGPLGLTRREVARKHLRVCGRVLPEWLLRMQITPMLERAGLITQEPDPKHKRRMLIHPISREQETVS